MSAMQFTPQEFYYHLNWRARSVQPGSHATRTSGGSADFQSFVPFMENPNPRRIDLRATLRTVPRQLMSRAYYERGAIAVYAIVDLSASMRFSGNGDKLQLTTDIATSVAWSALRSGDNFGLIACDDAVRADLFEPPSHRLGLPNDIYKKLSSLKSFTKNVNSKSPATANALPLAAQQLRQKRSLVFLISDFHLSDLLLTNLLASLSQHDVVPIVLWDTAEFENIPTWGWARLQDMESEKKRALFLRPSLVRQIKAAYIDRKNLITQKCLKFGLRKPFFVEDHFNTEHLTRHLLEAS